MTPYPAVPVLYKLHINNGYRQLAEVTTYDPDAWFPRIEAQGYLVYTCRMDNQPMAETIRHYFAEEGK